MEKSRKGTEDKDNHLYAISDLIMDSFFLAWWYGVLLLEKDINWELVESFGESVFSDTLRVIHRRLLPSAYYYPSKAPIFLTSFHSFVHSFLLVKDGRGNHLGISIKEQPLCIVRFVRQISHIRIFVRG